MTGGAAAWSRGSCRVVLWVGSVDVASFSWEGVVSIRVDGRKGMLIANLEQRNNARYRRPDHAAEGSRH